MFENTMVTIQVQDASGLWRNVGMSTNNAQQYSLRMKEISMSFPGQRIRVVDSLGHLLDLM